MFQGYIFKPRQLQRHNKSTNSKKRSEINRALLPHYAIYAGFDHFDHYLHIDAGKDMLAIQSVYTSYINRV